MRMTGTPDGLPRSTKGRIQFQRYPVREHRFQFLPSDSSGKNPYRRSPATDVRGNKVPTFRIRILCGTSLVSVIRETNSGGSIVLPEPVKWVKNC